MSNTRQEIRNKKAELVCRELRYQFSKPSNTMDLNDALTLLLEWMKYTPKIKYVRPSEKERTDKFKKKLKETFQT